MSLAEKQIRKYICQLSWNCSETEQQFAINMLSTVSPSSMKQVFKHTSKDIWENAVQVIANYGFPKNKELLPDLLQLLQDINWPGARHSIIVLSAIPKKFLIPPLEYALQEAYDSDDSMWISGLAQLLNAMNIKQEDFTKITLSKILEKSDSHY